MILESQSRLSKKKEFMKKLILITAFLLISSKALSYTTHFTAENSRERYLMQCWSAESQEILATDYCLEIGEKIGFVNIK